MSVALIKSPYSCSGSTRGLVEYTVPVLGQIWNRPGLDDFKEKVSLKLKICMKKGKLMTEEKYEMHLGTFRVKASFLAEEQSF